MSLPVVSYGTYNYGDYARPKAIQYKGGLGEGITAGFVSIMQRERLNKEKAQAQLKEANEQSLLLSSQFNAKLNAAFGKASATNRQFLQQLKQEYGNAVKAYKLDNLSFEEYEDKITYFQNILNDATQLSAIMKPIIESDKEISFEDARSDADNQAAVMAYYGVQNGKYILERDENGLRVVLPHGSGPSNFEAKSISASELISNVRYMTPEIKYDNLTNAAYGNMLKGVQETILNNSDFLNIKNDTALKSTLFSINENQKENIVQKISEQQGLRNIFISADGTLDKDKMRYYYEDNMGMGLGSYKGTKEQLDAMNMSIAEDMYESMASMEVLGKKPYSPPKATGDTANNAITAFNDSLEDPLTFYNTQVLTSPTTSERAESKGNGIYHLITFNDDGKQNPPVVIDLKNFTEFQKYAGTIQTYHRSIAGTSAEVRQAVSQIANIDELKQRHNALLEKIKNEPRDQSDIDVENFNNIQKVREEEDYKLAIQDIPTNYNNWDGRIKAFPRFRGPDVEEAKNEHSNLLLKQKQARKKYEKMFPDVAWPWQK